MIAAAALTAAAVIAGASFAAGSLLRDKPPSSAADGTAKADPEKSPRTGGGDPAEPSPPSDDLSPEAEYTVARENVPVTIQAPRFTTESWPDSGVDGVVCNYATATYLNLDTLRVDTSVDDAGPTESSGAYPDYSLKYLDCSNNIDDDEPTSGNGPTSGIMALNGAVMGSVDRQDVTGEECRDAARSSNLPNPVTIPHIQKDSTLKKDTGICVETGGKRKIVLLWITEVRTHPDNDNLRSYVTTATQWNPDPTRSDG